MSRRGSREREKERERERERERKRERLGTSQTTPSKLHISTKERDPK
jgi:hypothetical protein